MQGFPFDSVVTFDELGNPSYDRAISSQPLRQLISKLFTTGVMPNPSSNMIVQAGTEGMTTVISEGFAIVEGCLKLQEESVIMMHQAADSTYDRIDTVVLRLNENDNARYCDFYVLSGTPSATPVRPELNRSGSIYEIGLADVLIKANSSAISQQRITDTRYETERCGVVHSISEYDTTYIYEQVQADLAGFKADEQADFIEWFNEMKDQLSEDAAGHLQNELDERVPVSQSEIALVSPGATNKAKIVVTALGVAKLYRSTDGGLTWDSGKPVGGSDEIIADVEETTTASKAYEVGDYIMYDGDFYKVTSDIDQGDSLVAYPTSNYNIKSTKIGYELAAVNQNLTNLSLHVYESMTITSSTKYSDIFALISASVAVGKVPHIICEYTVQSTTFHNACLKYANNGYASTQTITFSSPNGDGSAHWGIAVRTDGTFAKGGETATNMVLWY